MASRTALPDWPRLMSLELAAAYFSVSVNTFRSFGIMPIETGCNRILYNRRDLDLYVDRLSGQPLDEDETVMIAAQQERAFLARRQNGR